MEFGMKFSLFVWLLFAFCGEKAYINAHKCNFPAIFNFGDSNSDTGGAHIFSHSIVWPMGIGVGHVFKRASDGRLIIDYLAESLGLPYLNASVDTNGMSFKYGANFAVGGQRINPDPLYDTHFFDHYFDEQVSRFFAFKSSALASKEPECTNIYPKAEVFSEALYTIDIGQNDVNSGFGGRPVLSILDYFTYSVKRLLDNGAKYFWIHNTGPLGCVPSKVNECPSPYPSTNCTLDSMGCRVEYNANSQKFNSELKKRVYMLRKEYPKAVITLVDMYAAKYNLISNSIGFDSKLRFGYCCGSKEAYCGKTVGSVFGGACKDPSKYISWDGMHYTQAANKIIAKHIIHGDFSDPPVAFSDACHK